MKNDFSKGTRFREGISLGRMLGLALGVVAPASALSAPEEIDTSIVEGYSPTDEEKMVSEGLPSPSNAPLIPDTLEQLPDPGAPEAETVSELGPLEKDATTEEAAPAEALDEITIPAESTPLSEASNGDGDGQSVQRFDRSIPLYERENPNWGFQVHGSLQALGTKIDSEQLDVNGVGTGVIENSDVRNFGLAFEYQPEFFQSIGVLSFGPSFNMYVFTPQGDLTSGSFSVLSLGGSIKYQLKFLRGQWFVPFVGFETQVIRYNFQRSALGNGMTTAAGPTGGFMVLLNGLEPSAAHALYADSGIKRSYLVGEIKSLTAGLDTLSSDGPAIYFGLRLER